MTDLLQQLGLRTPLPLAHIREEVFKRKITEHDFALRKPDGILYENENGLPIQVRLLRLEAANLIDIRECPATRGDVGHDQVDAK